MCWLGRDKKRIGSRILGLVHPDSSRLTDPCRTRRSGRRCCLTSKCRSRHRTGSRIPQRSTRGRANCDTATCCQCRCRTGGMSNSAPTNTCLQSHRMACNTTRRSDRAPHDIQTMRSRCRWCKADKSQGPTHTSFGCRHMKRTSGWSKDPPK